MFVGLFYHQERLINIGPEEFVQTFIPRDDADLRVRIISSIYDVFFCRKKKNKTGKNGIETRVSGGLAPFYFLFLTIFVMLR